MKYTNTILFLLLLFSNNSCSTAKKVTKPTTATFYVGTATNLQTEGIYAYSINLESGDCTFQSKETGIINPSFLAVSPNNKFLYALERIEGQAENSVRAYAISEKNGLKLINQQSTKGQGACYLSVDKAGQQVLIAHYGSGSVANLPIQADGSLGEVTDLIQHQGSSVNEERQEGPHAHYIRQGLGDKIYAADLGIDKVMMYEFKNRRLQANQASHLTLSPGSGPRHIDYHPKGKFLYVMNEMGGSVTVFAYNKAQNSFEDIQTISSLPANYSDFNKSADIHVHPSGKFLYASNRGLHDSIAAFKINPKTGKLSLIEIEQEHINWPRNFAISPDGQYLLCANLKDDSISIFKIDEATGVLGFSGQKLEVPKPLCIQFLNY